MESTKLSPTKRIFWYVILFGLSSILIFSFYKITVKFDYSWSWNKIPQYFVFENKVEIVTDIEGMVTITPDKPNEVVVKSEDGSILKFHVPQENNLVSDGDLVFIGDKVGYRPRWEAGIFIKGLWVTLQLSFASSLLALVLGLFTGLARLSSNPVLKWFPLVYVEAIRGTPLLVQLFIIYFMIGSVLGIDSSFACGMLGLGFFAGAYVAEIIRGGVASIHLGQMEAARSLGMSYYQSMVHIIFPQVFRRTLPALAGTFISLIKDSSLVSIMALIDLTKAGREVVASTFMVFETWITIAVLYFAVTFILSNLVKRLEYRLARGEQR